LNKSKYRNDIMIRKNGLLMYNQIIYNAAITREQFMFYELKITAGLICEGMTKDKITELIIQDNLFQYPTEKSIKRISAACIRRLELMGDKKLVEAIANQPSETAKQICLYAMMKQNRLVWDFMITVIGEKYRVQDLSFGKIDVNTFFARLQEQDVIVASWSDSTVKKIKQVLVKTLVESEYLDSVKATRLNPILLNPILENSIRSNNDDIVLPAFNCFS